MDSIEKNEIPTIYKKMLHYHEFQTHEKLYLGNFRFIIQNHIKCIQNCELCIASQICILDT